jgi:dipeptidyl aminopeptidase/acylaminoacyl peptidase
MWLSNFLTTYLLAANQLPLQSFPPPTRNMTPNLNRPYELKSGHGILSPKEFIQLPRPGEGVANPQGDLALVSVSQWSFKEKKNSKSIYVTSLDSNVKPVQLEALKDGSAFWLDSRTLAHVVKGKDRQEFYAVSLEYDTQSDGEVMLSRKPSSPTLIGSLPDVGASNFKYAHEANVLVFAVKVYDDYDLDTVKKQDDEWENRGTSARVYDAGFIRHWDEYAGPKKSRLFSVGLHKDDNDNWLLDSAIYTPLKGTNHYTPVEPFGGTDDFDVSSTHIVYTAKDPDVSETTHTRQNVYIVPLKGESAPRELTTKEHGAIHSVIVSPQGDKVAWLQLAEDGYESDRAQIVVYDLKRDVRYNVADSWDRSPATIVFSLDGQSLFFTAGDDAHVKLFTVPLPRSHAKELSKSQTPIALTEEHAASGPQPLPNGRLLFTQSSFTSPNNLFVIEGIVEDSKDPLRIQQITRFAEAELVGSEKHLHGGEAFYFEGAKGRQIQGWAIKPPGFKEGEKKKWPVVLLIHGGPQGAWEDQWSTRWNPNVFAHQGYFVIAINPTGSTTFGQELTDAITEDWGGAPFVDMKKGWEYALKQYPEIDPHKAVAAGASWGGYAINWINGHPEYGFGFKALVCHDGVFEAVYNGFATDELYFFNHDFGGPPWEEKSRKTAEKFNPSAFVHKWSTPQLLIHGGHDYRLAETESFAAYNALQSRGIPSRLVYFPEENHWVLNHGNSLKWHYEVFRWFDTFLNPDDAM